MNYYQRKTVARGILASKKSDIVKKLCPLMTNSKSKAYWMGLPDSDNVVDLADTREYGEYAILIMVPYILFRINNLIKRAISRISQYSSVPN